jgi:hypothetical protein
MIPASGHEWKPTPPVGKQPYYISARARCFPLLGYEMNGTTSKPEDVIVTAANDLNARFTTDSRWCLSNLSRG